MNQHTAPINSYSMAIFLNHKISHVDGQKGIRVFTGPWKYGVFLLKKESKLNLIDYRKY